MKYSYKTTCKPVSQRFYNSLKSCPKNELKLFITNFLGPVVPYKIRKQAAKQMIDDAFFEDYEKYTMQHCMTLQICKHSLVQNYKLGLFNIISCTD